MDNVVQTDNIFSQPSSMQLNGTIKQTSFDPPIKILDSSLDLSGNINRPFPPYRNKNYAIKNGDYQRSNIDPIRLGNNFDMPDRNLYKEDDYQRSQKSIYSPINFWFEDPSALFQTFEVVPNQNMTDAERLNAMTRVIILITAIMFVIKFPLWWMFLVIGIIVVIIMWYIVKGRDELYADHVRRQTEYLRRPPKSIIQPIHKAIISKTSIQTSNLVQLVQTQPLKLISIPY